MRDLRSDGVTVVLVGHRPAMMSALDRIAVMNEGRLEAFGPAAAVLSRMRAIAPYAPPAPASIGETSIAKVGA